MSSNIYNYQENELKPSLDFDINSSTTGAFTATQAFTCRYTDHASAEIRNKLKKGTRLIDLNPEIPAVYDFITLESYRVVHQAGGITKITASFAGASEDDSGFGGGEERSTSTSFRGTLTQKPIIEHPQYLKDLNDNGIEDEAINAIADFFNGAAELDVNGQDRIFRKKSNQWKKAGEVNAPNVVRWIDMIAAGRKYYEGQSLEWEVTQTNKGGLQDDDLDDFGLLIEEPPRNPPEPNWKTDTRGWWQFTDVSEDNDENLSVFTRTYTLRDEKYDLLDPNDPVKLLYTRQ
tara:strand:- start:608 stop:1477 length:870 start_codon:yes stop_codon:yes gene_type:complete